MEVLTILKQIQVSEKFENRFKFLTLSEKYLRKDLDRRDVSKLEKQCKQWNNKIEELEDLEYKAKEVQIEEGNDLEKIEIWYNEFECRMEKCRFSRDKIKRCIEEIKEEKTAQAKHLEEEEEEEEEYKRERQRRYEELELQKMETETQRQNNKIIERVKEDNPKVRLPKLVITPFNGTHMDWPRFWSLFETEIDKNNMPQVSKFSYLKELIQPKIKLLIDSLPFSSEGYERAKNILKDKYGKTSEIINAHVRKILQLPIIHGTNPKKIYEFYESLAYSVQVLDTMGRLKEINGNVRITLDKLPQVRPNLVMLDNDWKDWQFRDLVNALKQWTERNPPIDEQSNQNDSKDQKKDRMFQTHQERWRIHPCIYCGETTHRSIECKKVEEVNERKKIILDKKLCFNCTGEGHRANDCKSKRTCQNCHKRHHTSICSDQKSRSEKTEENLSKQPLFSTKEHDVIYPVAVVRIDGIKCRALLDTGAGSSYISASLARELAKKPIRTDHKQIETMLHTTNTKIEVYEVQISNMKDSFQINTEVSKVDKQELISLPNPHYQKIIQQFSHLKGIQMEDGDTKHYLPVHVILGASEYTKIKTRTAVRVRKSGEPIAEYTRFGWTIMAGGKEKGYNHMMLTRSSEADYAELCNLDVLGLKEESNCMDDVVYSEFKDQLGRNKEGWCETNILWKHDTPNLPSNKAGSLGRLKNLLKKLRKDPAKYQQYDQLIRDQLKEGIVERVPKGKSNNKDFYLPHRPVIRETAATTKMRIVFDASARENDHSPSLNDVTETGPSL